jgi:hypothetical protein
MVKEPTLFVEKTNQYAWLTALLLDGGSLVSNTDDASDVVYLRYSSFPFISAEILILRQFCTGMNWSDMLLSRATCGAQGLAHQSGAWWQSEGFCSGVSFRILLLLGRDEHL